MHAQDDVRFVLSAYVDAALRDATYDKLDDGSYGGRIRSCPGVVAFGTTLRECEDALRATLEDWILVGLKLGHPPLHHLPATRAGACLPVWTHAPGGTARQSRRRGRGGRQRQRR